MEHSKREWNQTWMNFAQTMRLTCASHVGAGSAHGNVILLLKVEELLVAPPHTLPSFLPLTLTHTVSVTRLCNVLNFLATNFITKVAQIIKEFHWAILNNATFMFKWFGYILGNIGKNWATFYSIIWSHCTPFAPNFLSLNSAQLLYKLRRRM